MLEFASKRHGTPSQPSVPDAAPTPPPRMRRFLPLAIAATAVTVVLPAVIVAALMPRGGVLLSICSAVLAVALSLLLATLGAALWKRQPHSRDVVFAELMLWCWARRCWTERRLSQARELFESARKAGPLVNIELLLGLSRLLEARDAYVHGHSQRVARHAVRISRAMGLSQEQVAKIRTAAEVHDVGKLYTPREVLNNPDRLTDEEFAIIKTHAARGAEMVSVIGDPEITAMVRHHHERIDGGGYPDGIAGAEIPLGARIISVADTFDAITSDRAYRRAGSEKRALKVLSAEAGAQLDAEAVAAFMQGYSARRSVAWYALGASALQRLLVTLQSTVSHLGVASVAAIAPALGAAGVLAVSPGLLHGSRSSNAGASGTSLALVQALRQPSAATQQAQSRSRRPGNGNSQPLRQGALLGGQGAVAPAGTPSSGAGAAAGAGANPSGGAGGATAAPGDTSSKTTQGAATGGAGATGTGGRTPGAGVDPTGSGSGSSPVAGSPKETTPTHAPTTQPSAPTSSTPASASPSVSTPPITTPSVTTPSVSAAGVTVPSVTVPAVTVPAVTVPPITLPHLPAGGGGR